METVNPWQCSDHHCSEPTGSLCSCHTKPCFLSCSCHFILLLQASGHLNIVTVRVYEQWGVPTCLLLPPPLAFLTQGRTRFHPVAPKLIYHVKQLQLDFVLGQIPCPDLGAQNACQRLSRSYVGSELIWQIYSFMVTSRAAQRHRMFKQHGEEVVGRTGATTTHRGRDKPPVPSKCPAFASPSRKRGGLPFHSACTPPAAPRRSLLHRDTCTVGSLKWSKLCVWRERGQNK